MIRKSGLWLVGLALSCCGACQTAPATGHSHTLVRQRSVSLAAAFEAAERAVSERFRVMVADRAKGLVRSAPVWAEAAPSPERIGDRLGRPRRVRKTVEVRVEPEGDGVSIGCKVLIEENQAGAHRLFSREHGLSDVPSDTPADRGAAATLEQDAVWRVTGRDRALERQICQSIRELLDEAAGSSSGGG